MLSFVRCRFTLGFHRANVKPLSANTRPFMNDSGDRFALARSRLSSRHGAAPREMITAHRLGRGPLANGLLKQGPRWPGPSVRRCPPVRRPARGITCAETRSVTDGSACPRRAATTCTGTPASKLVVSMDMPKIMQPRVRKQLTGAVLTHGHAAGRQPH